MTNNSPGLIQFRRSSSYAGNYVRSLTRSLAIAIGILSLLVLGACSSSSSSSGKVNDDELSAEVEACIKASEDFVTAAQISGADIIDGGLAYDKWWVAMDKVEPLDDHPLWSTQTTNTRSGSTTWRCKECHGWDYKGAAGAYNNTNSHFTGFPGVLDAKAKDPVEVFCKIRSMEDHSFGDVLTDDEIIDLTAFIVNDAGRGTIDYYAYLNADNMSTGDGAVGGAGSVAFANDGAGGCGTSFCHGSDGKTNTGNEFSLGDLAVDNPFEFMHKVRYGHPGSIMPAGLSSIGGNVRLSIQQITDITAFSQQQLPTIAPPGGGSAIEGDLVRGGLLYDNWPTIMSQEGKPAPGATETMPLFGLRADPVGNTRSGVGTWRCKECHGWDYEGANGVYATGSHFTGFPGVLAAKSDPTVTESYLLSFLKNGYTVGNVTYHKFSTYLSDADLTALVTFIKSGVIDTGRFISSFPAGGAKGDAAAGQTLYRVNFVDTSASMNCSACHDNDGQGINFGTPAVPEYVGGLSRGNPWEVLHKIRFGQPNTLGTGPTNEMPSALGSGFTNVDSADILTYSQTLP